MASVPIPGSSWRTALRTGRSAGSTHNVEVTVVSPL
jgi:hypothetical protein